MHGCIYPQGLQWSSFLVMTYFLLREYNILPKKELHGSPWVCPQHTKEMWHATFTIGAFTMPYMASPDPNLGI